MQTLEDWLPGRSPMKGTEDTDIEMTGSNGKMATAGEDSDQEGPQQHQQQIVITRMHHGQPQSDSTPPMKDSKRSLSAIQGGGKKSPDNPYLGDLRRLLDAEGEQLSQPKRQKRITDYPQMILQKPAERYSVDGEESAGDGQQPEEAGVNQTQTEDTKEQEAKYQAATSSV